MTLIYFFAVLIHFRNFKLYLPHKLTYKIYHPRALIPKYKDMCMFINQYDYIQMPTAHAARVKPEYTAACPGEIPAPPPPPAGRARAASSSAASSLRSAPAPAPESAESESSSDRRAEGSRDEPAGQAAATLQGTCNDEPAGQK